MMNSDNPSSEYPATTNRSPSPGFSFLCEPLFVDFSETSILVDEVTNPDIQEVSDIGSYFCDVFSFTSSDSDQFNSTPQVKIDV